MTETAQNSPALPVAAGTVAREEFAANQLAVQTETASAAVAAQAQATVQSRYLVAMKRPRDWDQVRVSLLKECSRPSFAAVARYNKPIGRGVQGPSIRFAEAAIRSMTNVLPESAAIYDDASKRIIRVSVTDLESNVSYSKDVTIEKTVERNNVREGQSVIRTRINSQGRTTYVIQAEDDELLNKQNALESKALRGLALRILPGDILDECMQRCIAILRDEAARDPDTERKKLVDAFASVNVSPSALKDFLGHELATVSPAELVDLRAVYTTIREGEASWADVLAHKRAESGSPSTEEARPKSAADLTAKLKREKAAKEREPGEDE